MNKLLLYIAFIAISAMTSCKTKTLQEQLAELPGVVQVTEIAIDTTFNKQYELYFEQYIDHKNPDKGTFKQRVVLSHKQVDLPMVAVLQGYNIWHCYADEPTVLLQGNQVKIEHRFFKDSKPDSIPWNDLTVYNAATDQHKIIKALQQIYSGKWLSTGISKGGQTTMYHKYFYPTDVDASIPYVAPLNFSREDERIYEFLNTVGSDEERQAIFDFQCLCFDNEQELIDLLRIKSKEKGWSFQFGLKKAIQYNILEYNFSYWQWGGSSLTEIPTKEASPQELFDHLYSVAGFSFFEDKGVEENRPFFWAALTELGIYGYQTKAFSKYLGDTADFTFDFTAPMGTNPKYDGKLMADVNEFLNTDASNMLFVVGGLDTWGSTSYAPSGKNNLVKMTLATGHHGTRIKHFDLEDRLKMYSLIEDWMDVQIIDIFEDK